MKQQDLFEFELKYGEKLENEVNTKNMTKNVGSAKETEVTSDFVLPASVKQEVFKQLVFANYLAKKDLVTSCKSKESMNYNLKVYINGGQHTIRWSTCDQSPDGIKFTKIADYIIKQSEMKQSEKTEVTVQGYVLQVENDTLLIGGDLNMLDYEWIKDELGKMDPNDYFFDFILLEGVQVGAFELGDKIQATIEGNIIGSKPGRAKVKDIRKLALSDEIKTR